MKRTTIKDVAEAAGVSITTVSHALSGKGVLKDETRDYVRLIAQELMYVPDYRGSSLKKDKNECVTLYIDTLHGCYYNDLAIAIQKEFLAQGYELEIILGCDSEKLLKRLFSNRVDGTIILNQFFSEDAANRLEQYGIPVVYMDRIKVGPSCGSVVLDSFHTGEIAARYLYGLGHRDFMMIMGRDNYNGTERYMGFHQYLERQGIVIPSEYCLHGNFNRLTAYHAVQAFLKKKLPMPNAIFAANDVSAFGCVMALREEGYTIPEDTSIVGCDDEEICAWFTPPLTTINPNAKEQGRLAAQMLLDLLNGKDGRVEKIQGQLIIRSSCVKSAQGDKRRFQ